MGGGAKVPEPSPEERALQKSQADLLALQKTMIEQQNEQNKILLPFLAQQEGFEVQLNDQGVITGITKIADPLEEQNREIQTLFNERSLKALKGELPVDPALENELTGQEEQLRERLLSQFGPGYETSSAGIETLGDFFQAAESLREGARTGQLTLAEQLGLTRQQQEIFDRQSSQDVLRTSAVADPMSFAGGFGQVARGYGQAQVPYIQDRSLKAQLAGQAAGQRMGLIGAGIGAIGAMFSDEDMKGELLRISETPHGIPIYVYTRKDTGERLVGVLASDVESVLPGSIYERGGYDMVQYGDLT